MNFDSDDNCECEGLFCSCSSCASDVKEEYDEDQRKQSSRLLIIPNWNME